MENDNRNIHLLTIQLAEKSIGKRLLDEGVIETYFHVASTRYGVDPNDPRIHEFHWSIGMTNRYDRICDLNTFPSLSRDVLEKMRPYEGMALKLGQRRTNYPIADYETEKINYLNHLRFWNHILDKHEINAIYFFGSPQHQMEYIIYALAKIKSIALVMTYYNPIPEVGICSSDLMSSGDSIKAYYENSTKAVVDESDLIGPVLDYYRIQTKDDDTRNQERKKTNYQRNELKRMEREIFGRGNGRLAVERYIKQHIKFFLGPIMNRKMQWIPIDREDLAIEKQQRKQIRYYLRHQITRINRYDRMAEEPDYEKKYIYYALQLTPEETTMPQGGVFAEQFTTVQLIARAAEKLGLEVYVKDHFVQPFRDRRVYDIIRSIPNVRLIRSTVSSFNLISGSVAVSTQTGSCIMEAAFRGKPTLVTGDSYSWRGLPCCFQIDSEEQCEGILKDILNGKIPAISQSELRRYLFAVQKKNIYMHADRYFVSQDAWKKTYRSIYSMLIQWLRSGFDLDKVENCLDA